MRSALFLILAFCSSFASADILFVQHLNEIKTSSNLYAASSMVYFNPKDRTPDERTLIAAFAALNQMDTRVRQLGSPPDIDTMLIEMNSIFSELDKTKRSQSAIYPERVLRILQLNKDMQAAVDKAYQAELEATPSPLVMLNQQSEGIAALLMDYQLRRYPLEDEQKAAFAMDPAQLPVLDQKLDANFKELIKKYPANADYLEPAYRNYRFVRKQLLQSKGRPNGGAEFYMTRTIVDLNDLGSMLAVEAEGGDADNPQDRR